MPHMTERTRHAAEAEVAAYTNARSTKRQCTDPHPSPLLVLPPHHHQRGRAAVDAGPRAKKGRKMTKRNVIPWVANIAQNTMARKTPMQSLKTPPATSAISTQSSRVGDQSKCATNLISNTKGGKILMNDSVGIKTRTRKNSRA